MSPSRKAIHDTQEKDLTTILLDRLNKTEGQKDPEAEALIRQATAERHGAPYYLVQTVLIQDLSLHNAQRRITDLETQLTEPKLNSSAAPSFLGGPSFLGAVFDRSEPSRDVPPNNVSPGGLGTGPLRSRRCSNRVLFPNPPTRNLSLLALD